MHIQRSGFSKALTLTALAFCTATLSLPAAADINFDISASNYRYTVKDLKPEDGQAAQFIGNLGSFENRVQGRVQQDDAMIFSAAQQSRSSRDKPPSIAWDDKLSAQGNYTFDANNYVTGLSASGELDLPTDMEGRIDTFGDTANIFFQLAPHSEVSLSLDAVVKLSTDSIHESRATGWGYVEHWGRIDGEELNKASLSGNVGLFDGSFTDLVDRSETLTLNFVNASNQWLYGSFGFEIQGYIAQGVVTAVPEAPAPAMLAAGVGLMGLLGRRRARAKSQAPA